MSKKCLSVVLLVALIVVSVACCGCPGNNAKSNGGTVSPVTQPIVTGTSPPSPTLVGASAGLITAVPTPDRTVPRITRTSTGYIVEGSPETGSARVQLKTGKASFHIKLSNYAVGDCYSLRLTSAESPFSYASTHEIRGDSGAGDSKIVKLIPAAGTYQIALDYGDSWEIDVTQ